MKEIVKMPYKDCLKMYKNDIKGGDTMNGKHTEGPWKVTVSEGRQVEIAANDGLKIAGMYYTGHPENIRADASLIAAAPELLEACKMALPLLQVYRERVIKGEIKGNLLQGDYEPVRVLEAAIAAAEGRE